MLRVAMRQAGKSGNLTERRHVLCATAVGVAVVMLAMPTQGEIAHADGARRGGTVAGAKATPHGAPSKVPGYLGILFRNISDEQVAELHLKAGRGVEVVMVDHDGPAGKAGLRPHDVIVSLNGQTLASAAELSKMIHDAGVGAEVSLVVMRGEQSMTVTTQLAYRGDVEREARARMAAPGTAATDETPVISGFVEGYAVEPTPAPADPHGPGFIASMLHSAPYTGLALEAMEPQLAAYFGAPSGMGMLVQTVMPNSPAAMAGLRAGDVVLKADAVAIHSAADWTKRLHASKGGPIALVVLREKREIAVTLAPELKKHSMVEWPRIF